jgi:drug/metabolite transporter (DMT)-like permease
MALGYRHIDAASFVTIRAISGAAVLSLIMLSRRRSRGPNRINWRSVAMLFTYMAFFAFAYLSLSVGTGALILFGAVLLTMFGVAIRGGEKFPFWSWIGLAIAVLGLVYLVSPGVTAPDPLGALLMAIAGIAWGFYSLLGRASADPLGDTAGNFLSSVPLAIGISILFISEMHASWQGVTLAVASGVVASGLGYTIWYAALAGLTATHAATVQLCVPAIAAFGGVVLLSEPITLRLVIASVSTLGGIALVLLRPQ